MTFRRGSISMVAGPPGSMKTIMMLNVVNRMGPAVPTIYHSSDSDDFTMTSRSLAMVTGMPTTEAELMVMAQKPEAYEALKQLDHVAWSFAASPTIEHMWFEAEAYREINGAYPHHTVIDILLKVDYEGISEHNYLNLMNELDDMAREQETAVTIVHHTSESAKAGAPPPRGAIIGKGSQLPTLICTLWGDSQAGTLDIAVVKNRFGPQDATAETFFTMRADARVCLIEQQEHAVHDGTPSLFQGA